MTFQSEDKKTSKSNVVFHDVGIFAGGEFRAVSRVGLHFDTWRRLTLLLARSPRSLHQNLQAFQLNVYGQREREKDCIVQDRADPIVSQQDRHGVCTNLRT